MIKFRRQGGGTSSSDAAQAPTSLAYGEPAVASDGTIYIGSGSGKVVSRVKNADSAVMADDVDPEKYYKMTQIDQKVNDLSDDLQKEINAVAARYKVSLKYSSWQSSTSSEQQKGYKYVQTAPTSGITSGAPQTNSSSEFLSGCGFKPTGNSTTDETLAKVLEIINAGVTTTQDNGVVRVLVKEKPTADIDAYWTIRTQIS